MITIVTSSFPATPDDHRGIFVHRFAASLMANGHLVQVIRPTPSRRPSVFGGDGIIDNLKQRPSGVVELLRRSYETKQRLDGLPAEVEVVVAHWLLPSGLLAALSKGSHGHPVWIVCHSGGVRVLARLPKPVRLWIGSVLERQCDLLSFVTPSLMDRFLTLVGPAASLLESRCRILPMGIHHTAFSQVVHNPQGPVIAVARLIELKAIDRLLRAAHQRPEPPELRIVGDGPERARLVALARQLDLKVDWCGAVSPEQIPELLNGSSLAVLPSRTLTSGRREGFPTFALEALAGGLPLLTTDCWDMPSPIRKLPSVYRTADQYDSFRRGLDLALDDLTHTRSGGDQLRREVAKDFSWEVIGRTANDWISELRK